MSVLKSDAYMSYIDGMDKLCSFDRITNLMQLKDQTKSSKNLVLNCTKLNRLL